MRVLPAISTLLICSIGSQTVFADVDFNQCNSDIDSFVRPFTTSKYGGLNAFYSINKGISDGLQKSMSDSTLQTLYNFLYNKQGSLGTVINDVVASQAGAIAFFCVGLLLILVSLVLGITICSCRCCCNSCGVDKEAVTYPSVFGVIGMIFSLVTAFAFVITGVIIFNLSANNLYGAIDDSTTWIGQVVNDLDTVVSSGTNDMTCAVNITLDSTFDTIENQMTTFPRSLQNQFMTETGLSELMNYDFDGLNAAILKAQDDSKSAKDALNSLNCLTDVGTITTHIGEIDVDLADDKMVSRTALIARNTVNETVQKSFNQLDGKINGSIAATISTMQSTQQQINKQMGQIQGAVDQTMQTVRNLQNAINTAQKDITTWSGYKPVRASWQAAMSVPNCICLFFSLATGLVLVLWIFKGNNTPRGLGYFAVFGFYFVIFLAWLSMAVASVTFIGGWAISGTCKPMFEDTSFRVYGLVNINVTITGLNGTKLSVTPQQLLQNCYAQQTMFTAIGGDSLIDTSMVLNQLNLSNSQGQLDALIEQADLTFSFDNGDTLSTQVSDATTSLFNHTEFFNNGTFFTDCPGDTKNAISALQNLTASLNDVNARLQSLNNIVTQVDSNQNTPQTQALVDYTNSQFNLTTTTVSNSVESLLSALDTTIFPCYPLYLSYQNTGTIICDWFGGPVHGMWGAAGLAAIFFIPVAILLLCASKTIFTGQREKSFAPADERFDVQPVAVHRSKTAQDTQHDDVFAMPPIRSDPPEGLPRANVNYYANQPTAQAAAPWLDDSISKGSGLRRMDEGLQRRDPYDDYDSKSTGLRRTDPESSRPGLFGNDDRWGSVSAAGSGSGLRSNYEFEEAEAPDQKWSSTALRRM